MGWRGVRLGFVCLAAIGAAGCASEQQKIDTASSIQARDDKFLPYREYTSGTMKESGPLLSGEALRLNTLIGRVDRQSGAKQFAVEVLLHYSEDHRRKFESARSAKAEALTLVKVEQIRKSCSKKLGSCDYDEVVHVVLPEAGLRGAGAEGYPVKLFARSGHTATVEIAKPVIAALLAKVDADPAAGGGAKTSAIAH
ncbi:MAG: hypothetical protein ABL907_14595 [Hyphomicrobium sp.]